MRAAEELKGELEASQEDYQSFRKEMGAIDERTRELTESLEKLKAVAEQVCVVPFTTAGLRLTFFVGRGGG